MRSCGTPRRAPARDLRRLTSDASRGRFVYFATADFTLAAASAFDFSLSNSSEISTNVLPGLNVLPANAG